MQEGRILIADDEETLREAFARFLSSKGYKVTQAENGKVALDELKKEPYDLLITDMMMPEMTGDELLDSLETFEPEARPDVIVMTAFGTVESAIKGIKAGVSAYIRKPINVNELEAAVRTATERRRLARELKRYYADLDHRVEERTRELQALNEENERLYARQKATADDLLTKVNQLVVLNEMGHMARVSGRLDETAMVVVSAVVQGIGFDRVCLWLLDDEGKTLTLKACHGVSADHLDRPITIDADSISSMPLEEGDAFLATGSVCDFQPAYAQDGPPTGNIIFAPLVTRNLENKDLHCWEHFNCAEESCTAFNNSVLACWMIKDSCARHMPASGTLLDKVEVCKHCAVYKANRRGRSIGFLCADNRASGRPIGQEDLRLLNVFASSAAILIENIMLMEKLSKNELFIDSIIFNMSSGLLVTDLTGRVKMLNFAGAEILRCEREDVLGRIITEVFPETKKFIEVEEYSSVGQEVSVNTQAGPVPVGYSNSRLIEHGEVSDGVIVVFRDLSEIKKLQEQLREEDRFAAIGKVAAGVAHEIRNPLFGITSVAQILGREVKEDSPMKSLIDAMLSETSRLNTLVEDMLLYGRTVKAAPQPFDLHGLIDSVLDFHMAVIKNKDLKVVKDFDQDMPPLMLDPNQMRQVFLNVLVNALDASNRGGEIQLKTKKLKDKTVVKVTDNGIGIPEDDLPKVFDLFYTTKEKGTGLGLAICRKIVEDHGGTVSIQSRPGSGTTVSLTLPRPPV